MITNPALFWAATAALIALLVGFLLGHIEGRRQRHQATELTNAHRTTIGV